MHLKQVLELELSHLNQFKIVLIYYTPAFS